MQGTKTAKRQCVIFNVFVFEGHSWGGHAHLYMNAEMCVRLCVCVCARSCYCLLLPECVRGLENGYDRPACCLHRIIAYGLPEASPTADT